MGFFIYIQFHLHRLHPLKEDVINYQNTPGGVYKGVHIYS